jgi:hypothetical protein
MSLEAKISATADLLASWSALDISERKATTSLRAPSTFDSVDFAPEVKPVVRVRAVRKHESEPPKPRGPARKTALQRVEEMWCAFSL